MNCASVSNSTFLCFPYVPNQELYLSEFISFVLRQARTNHCPGDVTMQLLEHAWEAQKRLWQLRNRRILNECKVYLTLNAIAFKPSTHCTSSSQLQFNHDWLCQPLNHTVNAWMVSVCPPFKPKKFAARILALR